jgi:hypothetical protein
MLNSAEGRSIADHFGASSGQIRRDHLISHLLAALTEQAGDQLIFFGGTALSRTLLPDGRLSEDIDLIARGSRRQVADHLTATLPRALRREFPRLSWEPSLSDVRDVDPALLRSPDGLTVRLQLLDPIGYPNWPVHMVDLVQRYSDAPPARLMTPTPPAFAAWKTTAWFDRAAARDLYDLWALARIGQVTADAARLFVRFGPTNRPPDDSMFAEAPDEDRWRRDLGGQLRLDITAADALEVVKVKWAEARTAMQAAI